MHVLGLSNNPDARDIDSSWVRVTTGPALRVPKVVCPRASSVQVVLFERPHPGRMQYISLNPVSLALNDTDKDTRLEFPESGEEDGEREERLRKEKKQLLVEKLKQHSVLERVPSAKERALAQIVNQINWAWELEKLLQKNVSLIGPRPKRGLSVSERVVESATTMRDMVMVWIWELVTVYVLPVIKKIFVLGIMSHRIAAEMLLLILEWRPRP